IADALVSSGAAADALPAALRGGGSSGAARGAGGTARRAGRADAHDGADAADRPGRLAALRARVAWAATLRRHRGGGRHYWHGAVLPLRSTRHYLFARDVARQF